MQTARILIIEDDHGSRNALAEILRDEGFEVRAVASGEEGLHCAERFQPSFAIVDVHLPDSDGIELVRKLRESCPECACVVASGSATFTNTDGTPMIVDFSAEAREAGAIEYLCKPIDVDKLLGTLYRQP